MQLGYRAGGDKIWYSKRSQRTVCREYLLCLITSDDLFTRGAECVPHQAKKSFYAALLKDPASVKAPQAQAPLFDGKLVADMHDPASSTVEPPVACVGGSITHWVPSWKPSSSRRKGAL